MLNFYVKLPFIECSFVLILSARFNKKLQNLLFLLDFLFFGRLFPFVPLRRPLDLDGLRLQVRQDLVRRVQRQSLLAQLDTLLRSFQLENKITKSNHFDIGLFESWAIYYSPNCENLPSYKELLTLCLNQRRDERYSQFYQPLCLHWSNIFDWNELNWMKTWNWNLSVFVVFAGLRW